MKRRAAVLVVILHFLALLTLISIGNAGVPVPPPAGLVGWWPGDGNAVDIWSGNNGTLMNGASFATGMVSEAFSLDGADDFVNIPDSPTLNITEAMTLDVWVKVPPVPSGYVYGILDKGDSAYIGGAYSLRLSDVENYDLPNAGPNLAGRANFLIWIGEADTWPNDSWHINSQTRIDDDNWHFIAAVYDGSMMKMYVDAVLETTFNVSGSIRPTNMDLTFGRRYSGVTSHLPGLIDEVEIFNRALSLTEIQSLYYAGDSGKMKPTIPGQKASLNVVPASATVGINGELMLNVTVSDIQAPGLWAYEFNLRFDPGILEGVSAGIPLGHFLTPVSPSMIFIFSDGSINNEEGSIHFAVTLLSDEPEKTGGGVLCTATLRGKTEGSSLVTVGDVLLVNSNAEPFPTGSFAVKNGTVMVRVLPGDLSGDGKVDIRDLAVAAAAFGSTPSHSRWNQIADVNKDNIVNIIDLVQIALGFTA